MDIKQFYDVNKRTQTEQVLKNQEDIDALKDKDTDIEQSIDDEANARVQADASLRNDLNTNTNKIEYNTTQITALQNGKQDKLTAGTNITLDENNVISASGGISSVKAENVDSESATSGQVLTADGQGGASWQNASGGNTYLHNIQLGENFSYAQFYIISKSNTTFTFQTLKKWLYNNGFRTYGNVYGIGKFISTKFAKNISNNWTGMFCESLSSNISIAATQKTYTIVDNEIKIDYSTDLGARFSSFTDSVIEL